MFFTGYSRDADQVLEEQRSRSDRGDPAMIDNLHFVKELGLRSRTALERGDIEGFAALMHEHWEHKKKRSAGDVQRPHRPLVRAGAWRNGALGGKLVGAGAGGFLLFYTHDPRRLREAMLERGSDRGPLQLRPRRLRGPRSELTYRW